MQELGAIAGVASLVVTLATAIYLIGVWKGGVDNKVKRLCEDNQKYPPGETALMCKTMWDIYVVDALRERPDLAQHMSPFKLTEAGRDLIPEEIKEKLDTISKNPGNREGIASGWLVVKTLGMACIEAMAIEKKLSIQEAIAILSTYFNNN